MAHQSHSEHEHADIISEIREEYQDILDESDQAIYIYLDDTHKLCNQKCADLLGYASPEEWAAVEEPFTDVFVGGGSAERLVTAYQNAMEHFTGATIEVSWQTKAKGEVKTRVMLVPISAHGHTLAMHFIEKV